RSSPVMSSAETLEAEAAVPVAAAPVLKPERDNRLDFWRGFCLIDMLLVHLVHQGMSLGKTLDVWVGEYTRFAAGGFVFIAGMSIGRIFLPRVRDPAKRWKTYQALWRRAGVILLVHYVAEIGYLVMYPLFATMAVPNLRGQIWAILTMRSGYDLLPFYVVVVALAPGMLEVVRRGYGWALGLTSVLLFTWGQWDNPWSVALPNQQAFLPILWQSIFVAGLLGGAVMPAYDRLSRQLKVGLAVAAALAHVVLFIACYGPDFGLRLWLPMAFSKVPLTTGEALRYLTLTLAILFATDLVWRPVLDGNPLTRFAERLGRNSLAVFVFHVWVVQLMVRAANGFEVGFSGRLVLSAAGLTALWVFAGLVEAGNPKKTGRDKSAKAKPGGRVPVGGVLTSADRPAAAARWPGGRGLLAYRVGGMASLTVATLVAVLVSHVEQRKFGRKWVAGRHRPPVAQRPFETTLGGHTFIRAPWDGGPLPSEMGEDLVEDPEDDTPDDPDGDGVPGVTTEPAAPAFGGSPGDATSDRGGEQPAAAEPAQ
ncbi:MAG: hypothetical protein JWO31_643, partial [Phycisphaerales bacterium]|nr:hypothetical protein [Phycisphaerales bacterium]